MNTPGHFWSQHRTVGIPGVVLRHTNVVPCSSCFFFNGYTTGIDASKVKIFIVSHTNAITIIIPQLKTAWEPIARTFDNRKEKWIHGRDSAQRFGDGEKMDTFQHAGRGEKFEEGRRVPPCRETPGE